MNQDVYSREQWLLDQVNEQGYINVECASCFIQTISYQVERHTLIVHMLKADVPYYDFPWEEFVKFVNSDSKGSHYNYYIRGHY